VLIYDSDAQRSPGGPPIHREHRRSQGVGQMGHVPAKLLENIFNLCFEKRFSKQISVIRLKSNILSPPIFRPPNFWAGYATDREFHTGADPSSKFRGGRFQ